MHYSLTLSFSLILLVFISCPKTNEKPLFQLMDNTGINFNSKVTDGKLENSFLFGNFYNGSSVAIGDLNNQKLRVMTKLSSVNSISCLEVNDDGKKDLVIGGNLFTFLLQFERLDASFGDVLLNGDKGNLKWVAQKKTGLM
jgi:hypothetical protein